MAVNCVFMEENRIISENDCKHSMEITIEIKTLIFDLVRHVYGITIKYAQSNDWKNK
jgi:hypothetical protein